MRNQPVGAVRNTGKRVIPSSKCSHETESTTGDDAITLGGTTVILEVTDSEHEEGHIERKKQEEESHSRSERAEQQEEGEDEPAHQEETEGVEEDCLADFG